MPLPPIPKAIVYKRAVFQLNSTETLEQLLRRALLARGNFMNRAFPLDKGEAISSTPAENKGRSFWLINQTQNHRSALCGDLIRFTFGEHAATVAINFTASVLEEGLLEAEEGKEFMDSPLYFSVVGNHVLASQSFALRTNHLEDYLNWMFNSTSGFVADGQQVTLADQPKPSDEIALRDIKSFTLGVEVQKERRRGRLQEGQKRYSLPATDRGILAIKRILGVSELTDRLPTEVLEGGAIDVALTVTWRKRKPDHPNEFMDAVAQLLSHSDLKYTIFPMSGGSITQDDMKLSKSVPVARADSGAISPASLYTEMLTWLSELQRSQRVAP